MVESGGALQTVLYGGGTGLGIGSAFLVVRWIAKFIAERWDKREAHLDADAALIDGKKNSLIDRLEADIKRLTERMGKVEAELEECKRLHAEERAKRLELEALMMAKGEIRQRAQIIVAADKQEANGVPSDRKLAEMAKKLRQPKRKG